MSAYRNVGYTMADADYSLQSGILNFVNSQNSITFAGEESCVRKARQKAVIITVAMSLPTF